MMILNKLLKELGIEQLDEKIKFKSITRIEENIKKGTIFFCFEKIDLKLYLKIKSKGAILIFGEASFEHNDYIQVISIKKIYQQALLYLNQKKLKNKILIGVTGTNGKTTVSSIIYNFLKEKGPSIYYGSNGIFADKRYDNPNTTPSMELFLEHLNNQKYVVVEISSISFFEYRLFNIKFNYLIITNIYEDHLDYHITYKDYYYSKLLILATNPDARVFISDDIKDNRIFRLNKISYKYGLDSSLFKVKYDNVNNIIYLRNRLVNLKIGTNLLGLYNIKNIIGVISLLYEMGYNTLDIEKFFLKKIIIPGRQNIYTYKGKTIIVDYPHTTSAYDISLSDLYVKYKKIMVVCGAGGNRQSSKRKEYGEVLSKYVKFVILTNDNPRFEDEMQIINDIIGGLKIPYKIELNRENAIKDAVDMVDEYDLILILGKGQEKYIEKKGEKIPSCDIDIVERLIS